MPGYFKKLLNQNDDWDEQLPDVEYSENDDDNIVGHIEAESTHRPPFQQRTFSMPCSSSEAMEVFFQARDVDDRRVFGDLADAYSSRIEAGLSVGQPPITFSIYMESVHDAGFTVAAGNRAENLWKMTMDFTGDYPIEGTWTNVALQMEPRSEFFLPYELEMIRIVYMIEKAVKSSSGRIGAWPSVT